MNSQPASRVSVVIPTVGRWDSLRATLRSLAENAGHLVDDIVIVGDGVTIPASQLEKHPFTEVRFVSTAYRVGANSARDLGATLVSSAYIVFLDDDVTLLTGWAAALQHALHCAVPAITGRVTTFETTILARAREIRNSAMFASLAAGDAAPFFAGGNSVISKRLFDQAGGFSELQSANGMATRLAAYGTPALYCPSLQVSHVHDRGFVAQLRHGFNVGLSCEWSVVLDRSRIYLRASGRSGLAVSAVNAAWIASATLGGLWRGILKARRPSSKP